MGSERYGGALEALKSEGMPVVIDAVIRANEADNAEVAQQHHDIKAFRGIDQDSLLILSLEEWSEMSERFPIRADRAKGLLRSLKDQYTDALCVVMYAGRDEDTDGIPYDEDEIDDQFSEWWVYLGMEHEKYVRELMAEKWPLGEYLRHGAILFGIGASQNNGA